MLWKRLRLTLEMIKFEHSVFALPFALTGALLAFRDGGYATARDLAEAALDRGGHGGGALRRHGLQPAGGCRYRRPQSAHPDAPPARRPAWAAGSPGASWRSPRRCSCSRPGELNPLCLHLAPLALGHRLLLLLHQALHLLLAPGAGLQPGDRAGGRVDRRARLARSAHPVAHRRGHLLDRAASTSSTPARITNSTAPRACSACRACSASPRALRVAQAAARPDGRCACWRWSTRCTWARWRWPAWRPSSALLLTSTAW